MGSMNEGCQHLRLLCLIGPTKAILANIVTQINLLDSAKWIIKIINKNIVGEIGMIIAQLN